MATAPTTSNAPAAPVDCAKIAELIAQDRHKLLMRHPFTGAVVMRLDIVVERVAGLDTAATDGLSIRVNPDFYATLNDEERLFVIAHEAWHCILMHFVRRRDRDHRRFNIASDLEIHFLLTKEGFRPPFVLPHDMFWNGLSAEEIYELLPKPETSKGQGSAASIGQAAGAGQDGNGTQSSKPQPDNGQPSEASTGNDPDIGRKGPAEDAPTPPSQRAGGEPSAAVVGNNADDKGKSRWSQPLPLVESDNIRSRGGEGFDRHDEPSASETHDAVEKIRQIVVSAAQTVERMRGKLPGYAETIVKSMLRPSFDWKTMLARFLTSCYGGGRRWLPPSRRHVHRGLYLPSMRQERLNAMVAIDTSGSTASDLKAFFSELCGILGSFGGYTITMLQCDYVIQSVRTFSSDDGPLPPDIEWKARGFGGTSFVPVFRYVESHQDLEPSLLVFFTDGYGPAPRQAPPYPVLWVLTSNGKPPAPWGAVARFAGR